MDTKSFYEHISNSQGYNIKSRGNLIDRRGLKRLLAFDDRFLTVSKVLSKSISAFNHQRKMRILDVGCGDGVFESLVPENLRKTVEFYGVDISSNQISKSKDLFHETKEVDFDNSPLPYKTSFFDLVICSDVLEHLFYPEHVLKEISRVLANSGKFLLTVPNLGALQIRLGILLAGSSPMINYPENAPHIRFFNKKNILTLTRKQFRCLKIAGLSSFLFGKWNSGIDLPTPRILQIFGNTYAKDLSLGLFFIFEKA